MGCVGEIRTVETRIYIVTSIVCVPTPRQVACCHALYLITLDVFDHVSFAHLYHHVLSKQERHTHA